MNGCYLKEIILVLFVSDEWMKLKTILIFFIADKEKPPKRNNANILCFQQMRVT